MADEWIYYLLPMMAIAFVAFASAILYERDEGFNRSVFICAMAIGFALVIWVGIFPIYFISISALLLVALIFSSPESEGGVE